MTFSHKLKTFNLKKNCKLYEDKLRNAKKRRANLPVATHTVTKSIKVEMQSTKKTSETDSSQEEPPSLPVNWRQDWNVHDPDPQNQVLDRSDRDSAGLDNQTTSDDKNSSPEHKSAVNVEDLLAGLAYEDFEESFTDGDDNS